MEYDVFWNPTRISGNTAKRAKKMMMYFNLKSSQFTRDAVELYTALLEEKIKDEKKINNK